MFPGHLHAVLVGRGKDCEAPIHTSNPRCLIMQCPSARGRLFCTPALQESGASLYSRSSWYLRSPVTYKRPYTNPQGAVNTHVQRTLDFKTRGEHCERLGSWREGEYELTLGDAAQHGPRAAEVARVVAAVAQQQHIALICLSAHMACVLLFFFLCLPQQCGLQQVSCLSSDDQ